jgi:hypothetical protein
MGRLTRLNEDVVEAVALEKTKEQEWRSKGLLAIHWRPNHMSIIHEAAQFGAQTRMNEIVVSNFPEEEEKEWDNMYAEENNPSSRLQELIELSAHAGKGHAKVDSLVSGLREENVSGEGLIVRAMDAYSNIEDVKLPKERLPSIDVEKHRKRVKEMQEEAERGHRPLIGISKDVAQVAWDRRARLDRPGVMPKVKEKCECPYCGTASPYQTHAYRVIEQRRKHEVKNIEEIKEADHRHLQLLRPT